MWPSCPYKPLNFQTLKHSQFLRIYSRQNSNFQFQERKMFVCLELWQKHQYFLTRTYLYTTNVSRKCTSLTWFRIQIHGRYNVRDNLPNHWFSHNLLNFIFYEHGTNLQSFCEFLFDIAKFDSNVPFLLIVYFTLTQIWMSGITFWLIFKINK